MAYAAAPSLRLAEMGQLTFEAPDEVRFPALRLAREALAAGGAAPIVLNAANEVAVDGFLSEQIGFLDIPAVVEQTLENGSVTAARQRSATSFEIDGEARGAREHSRLHPELAALSVIRSLIFRRRQQPSRRLMQRPSISTGSFRFWSS